MNAKAKTFLTILGGIGRMVEPRIGVVIDAGKALAHAKTDAERADALMKEVEADLGLLGDYSGKDAISEPEGAALANKFVEAGFALHAYIEAHKAKAAPAPSAVPTAGD